MPPPFALYRLAALSLLALAACQAPPEPTPWAGYAEAEPVYVAAPVAGQLLALAVQPGQTVAPGALLFQLDPSLSQAARAEAQARLRAAQAQADNGRSGRRPPEVASVAAQLAQAQAAAERTDAELQRQQALHDQGFIAQARLDDAHTAARQARERVAELQASLRTAQQPSARPLELQAALASAQAAAQVQAQALWREQQARQTAPVAGLVTDTFYRPGEYVAAGAPVLALLPPTQRKARFFVPQPALGGLALGQWVRLHCDGCGADIPAQISHIASQAEYTPPVLYSQSQRARLVVLVEARPSVADAPRLLPGQPLDVWPAANPANPASAPGAATPPRSAP